MTKKAKSITIYSNEEDIEEAKRQSKRDLGTENISGLFRFLINKNKKNDE